MPTVVRSGSALCPLIEDLPAEIRLQIYEYVLFENGSFFALDDEEGNSVPTLFPKLRAPPTRRNLQHFLPPADEAQHGGRRKEGSIMALLLTSKFM